MKKDHKNLLRARLVYVSLLTKLLINLFVRCEFLLIGSNFNKEPL